MLIKVNKSHHLNFFFLWRETYYKEEKSKFLMMLFLIKGYFAKVQNSEDAQEKVLQYIAVLARPMVLYQHDHPVQWTPVYAGNKFFNSRSTVSEDDNLMTSVSTPIFDRRNYSVSNFL